MKPLSKSVCEIFLILLIYILFASEVRAQPIFCETINYFDAGATTKVYIQKLPSPKWAVKMTPTYIPSVCTVDTAFIGFGIKKNSGGSYMDTIEIYVLDNNPPTFTQIDKDVLSLIPPAGYNYIADDFYMLELNFNTPAAKLNPGREFWLAYRFKGPIVDTIRTLFKSPAINEARSVVINTNGTTTLASQYVNNQIPTTVDLWAETHICYPYGIPVELQSLYVRAENNQAILNWTTASETGNYGFEIERVVATSESGSARVWQRIGFVPGHGSTTERQDYVYIDKDPIPVKDKEGFVTYRLRQLDIDGKVTLSPTVKLFMGSATASFYLGQNYPNPISTGSAFGTATTITYQISESGHTSLIIYNSLGEKVESLVNEYKPAGAYTINYSALHLTPGMYTYILTTGNNHATRQMVVVR